ncbi:MAG: TolB family protein, partial [Anaerolineales bacterium]
MDTVFLAIGFDGLAKAIVFESATHPVRLRPRWAGYFLNVLLALTITLSALTPTSTSAQQEPNAPPRDGRAELAHYPAESSNASPAQAVSASLFPWSKVVFQSLRFGNWDIFIGNDDGAGQTRLTASGDADIHPRLNRGVTRIVYISKQGDYEIRVMNTDGSAGQNLTSNDQDDVAPAWSPDSSRIAFQS